LRICSEEDAEAEIAAGKTSGSACGADEPGYPPRLALIDDAPPCSACGETLEVLARPMIAIVGSRNASGAGLKFTERLARDLGDAGFSSPRVSRAVSTRRRIGQHRQRTIAVLAGGHDRIYPAEHEDLLEAMLQSVPRSRKCRSDMCRARGIFRGATG